MATPSLATTWSETTGAASAAPLTLGDRLGLGSCIRRLHAEPDRAGHPRGVIHTIAPRVTKRLGLCYAVSVIKHPAAYLRRSYVDAASPGDISLDAQRSAVRALAQRDGHNGDLIEYNDWGISADVAKSGKRIEYNRLLAAMAAGEVSALYAFDVDRLYRDPRDLIRLQDAAQRHDVRIVTSGGPLAIGDGDDPAQEAFAFIGAIFGRLELQKAKKRARAGREARVRRGDRFGHPPYGWRHARDDSGRIVRVPDPQRPLQPLLGAYQEAGSVLGAVRLLNERGVPSPKGGKWYTATLTHLLDDNWRDLLPKRGASGKRIPASAIFSQVFRCHCGHVLTPNVHRKQLFCSYGQVTPDHGRKTVQEAALLPWAREEAARLRAPSRVVRTRSAAAVPALEAKRERIAESYIEGLIDKATRDARLAVVAADLDKQAAKARAQDMVVPSIDWAWPPAKLNAVLRALWDHVQLDERMQPVSAAWHVPEWRS